MVCSKERGLAQHMGDMWQHMEAVLRVETHCLTVEVRERRIGPGKRVAIAVVAGRRGSSKRLEEGSR